MIEITKIIPGGQALGTHSDGRKIFFWNALPGEFVTDFTITKKKSHYYEAIATKIKNPSKFRVTPKDDCYLSTSPWQIIDWDYENQLKYELIIEIFREHHLDLPSHQQIRNVITDNRLYFYRNKMEYSLYWDNEQAKIKLSFHARGSHRKIPITQSSLEQPAIFNAANDIIDTLNSKHEEARKYQSILLRANQNGKVSGGLYENHQPHPHFPPLTDQILGYAYSYSPNGFFQVNLPVYELALKTIQKHITTNKVLDLYAGVGTIGLSVARDRELTLVEVDKFAYDELCNNLKSVDNKSISAQLTKSESALDYITPDTTVIVDPPRAGCHKTLLEKIIEVMPPKVIYLSCNPATQARDLEILLTKYDFELIQPFNFFPRTPHIENLAILSLKSS